MMHDWLAEELRLTWLVELLATAAGRVGGQLAATAGCRLLTMHVQPAAGGCQLGEGQCVEHGAVHWAAADCWAEAGLATGNLIRQV